MLTGKINKILETKCFIGLQTLISHIYGLGNPRTWCLQIQCLVRTFVLRDHCFLPVTL